MRQHSALGGKPESRSGDLVLPQSAPTNVALASSSFFLWVNPREGQEAGMVFSALAHSQTFRPLCIGSRGERIGIGVPGTRPGGLTSTRQVSLCFKTSQAGHLGSSVG